MKKLIFALAMLCVLCGCKDRIPEMQDYEEWTVSGVAFDNDDFSGITGSFDGSCFITVFNSGGMYKMEIPSDGDTELKVSPLWAYDHQFFGSDRDLEAVTVDKLTGDIYYTQERSSREDGEILFQGNTLYKLSAPEYDCESVVETFGPEYVPDNNYTFEGCAWVGKDKLVLGREGDHKGNYPPAFFEYTIGEGVTRIIDASAWTKQIAAVCYDEKNDCFWTTDSDYDRILFMVDRNYEPVASFDIGFIDNAEGVWVDHERHCIWIASDESPSKLYKLNFKGI